MGRYFEDFAVGQRVEGGERKVTEEDLRPLATVSGDMLCHELGLLDEPVVALLDTNWRYLGPVHVGDTLRFETTITRCRRSRSGEQGTVNRHVVLFNQHGDRVQRGTTAVLVRTRGAGADPVGRAFGTVAWGEALARRLADDARFTAATAGPWQASSPPAAAVTSTCGSPRH